jgi:hypothetical protein
MPVAIENEIKTNVIKEWLLGDTRDKIATNNAIGAGTVSGIINEWKQGIDALEYESVRELSIWCKKQGINLGTLASSLRTNNYVQKLGANQDEIEVKSRRSQIAQISTSDSISLEELGNRVKEKELGSQNY